MALSPEEPEADRLAREVELRNIGRRCASLPTLDDRPEEGILGYDERGLPRCRTELGRVI